MKKLNFNSSYLLLGFNWVSKIKKLKQYQCKIPLGQCESCTSTQILQEKALFSGKNYTAAKNPFKPCYDYN